MKKGNYIIEKSRSHVLKIVPSLTSVSHSLRNSFSVIVLYSLLFALSTSKKEFQICAFPHFSLFITGLTLYLVLIASSGFSTYVRSLSGISLCLLFFCLFFRFDPPLSQMNEYNQEEEAHRQCFLKGKIAHFGIHLGKRIPIPWQCRSLFGPNFGDGMGIHSC